MQTKPLLLATATLLGAAVVASIGVAQVPQAAAPADPAMVAHGKAAFVAQGCYQCHGYAGQGSQSTGPALVPLRLSDVAFEKYVRNPRGVMPAFSAKILPADTLTGILAYIRALPPGRPIGEIPLLAPYAAGVPKTGGKAADGS